MANFQAYNADKTIKAHIKKAFLKSFVLTAADIHKKNVRLHDRTKWNIFFDSPMMGEIILQEIQEYGDAYVIGSFQLTINGSQNVILRKDQVEAEISQDLQKEY